MAPGARTLVGNRLALIGAIWYLLEWVAIAAFARVAPPPPGRAADVASYYASQATNLTIASGLFALVEIGRIAFVAGVRVSLRQTPHIRGLLDLSLGAMALSVALELGQYSLAAAAGQMAAGGGERVGVISLAYASASIGLAVRPAIAVAVEAASLAQVLSGQFPRWISILGTIAGAYGILTSTYQAVGGGPFPGLGLWIPAMWIWMVATGVVLFRQAEPLQADVASAASDAVHR